MKKQSLRYLKLVIPWCIAALVLVWIFHKTPPAKILETINYANLLPFFILSIIYVGIIFLLDTWGMSVVFRRFHYPIHTSDLLPARAATYLIMITNYIAAQGAFAYYLKRRKNIPILESLGTFVYVQLTDLYILVGMVVTGSFMVNLTLNGKALRPFIQSGGIIAVALLAAHTIYWHYFSKKEWRITRWLRQKPVFRAFHHAKFSDYIITLLARIPVHLTYVIAMFLLIKTFHASAPLVAVVGGAPIPMILSAGGISPGGLGVFNEAMQILLSPFTTSPAITAGQTSATDILYAATLLWLFCNMTLKAILGFFYLSRVSKDLFKPS